MVHKNQNNKYQIVEIIIIFIFTLLFNLMCNSLTNDEIWNYGFTYNIATGLIPYKDFNMVVTPLFPMLGALFLKLFGINMINFQIFNTLICTAIFYYMKKSIPKSYCISYLIFLLFSLPNYNVLSILLLYILITLENNNKNDYIIGLVLGLTFLTKQNIGIYLCIPTLFTKNIKKIIKRIIGFIVPNITLLIYLIVNNCLYEFLDYIFLGMSTFAKENLMIIPSSLIIVIISYIYLIYRYIKIKDIKIIYLMCFQLLVFPLIEPYHVMIAIVPTIGYFLSTLNLNKKIITYTSIVFITTIFLVNINIINKKEINYPNNTTQYKYRKILYKNDEAIKYVSDYLNTIKDELYVLSSNAYLYKLEAKIKINKYDLLNNGNLGSKGYKKIIEEIENNCSNKKCTFLVDTEDLKEDSTTQYNKEILKHIVSNYTTNTKLGNTNLIIYKNYH